MEEINIGDRVKAIVQIDYQMEEVEGTIMNIVDTFSPGGLSYLLDCDNDWQHWIGYNNNIKKVTR